MKTIIEPVNCCNAPDLGKLFDKQLMQFLKVASSNRVLFILCKKIRQYDYLGMTGRIFFLIAGKKVFIYNELLDSPQ